MTCLSTPSACSSVNPFVKSAVESRFCVSCWVWDPGCVPFDDFLQFAVLFPDDVPFLSKASNNTANKAQLG